MSLPEYLRWVCDGDEMSTCKPRPAGPVEDAEVYLTTLYRCEMRSALFGDTEAGR